MFLLLRWSRLPCLSRLLDVYVFSLLFTVLACGGGGGSGRNKHFNSVLRDSTKLYKVREIGIVPKYYMITDEINFRNALGV